MINFSSQILKEGVGVNNQRTYGNLESIEEEECLRPTTKDEAN